MMRRVFDELGYRRYEWKCDALNAASRRAAERLGFVFEGVFRQATIYKGRNRDTAWYSIIDAQWPALKNASSAGSSRATWMPKGARSSGFRISSIGDFLVFFSWSSTRASARQLVSAAT